MDRYVMLLGWFTLTVLALGLVVWVALVAALGLDAIRPSLLALYDRMVDACERRVDVIRSPGLPPVSTITVRCWGGPFDGQPRTLARNQWTHEEPHRRPDGGEEVVRYELFLDDRHGLHLRYREPVAR